MADAWFRPKQYGYGATPANWKGWVLVVGSLAAIGAVTFALIVRPANGGAQPGLGQVLVWAAIVAAILAVLVRVSRARTDGEWRWRWGGGG